MRAYYTQVLAQTLSRTKTHDVTMMTGRLRVLAFGALLLAVTTTTTFASSDLPTTDDTNDSCLDEIDACQADEECLGCIGTETSTSADQDACTDAWIEEADADTFAEVVCASLVGGLCCSAIASDIDCTENTAFVEWVACSVGDCADDRSVCDEILGGEGTALSDGASSGAAVSLGLGWTSTALVVSSAVGVFSSIF